MLDLAFQQYPNVEEVIFQSDQGWQYQMQEYQQRLKEKGIVQSMSRKGNYLDNSLLKNFFGKMKNEMFYGYEYDFETVEELEQAIIEYIDYYNTQKVS